MNAQKLKHRRQFRRACRVRNRIVGTTEKPRLSVFRSVKHIYAQLIDDVHGVTLASVTSNSKEMRTNMSHGGNIQAAIAVGKKLAEIAVAKGIQIATFDRGHYRFHGRIKALAQAATVGGLKCTGLEDTNASPSTPKDNSEGKQPETKKKEPKATKSK